MTDNEQAVLLGTCSAVISGDFDADQSTLALIAKNLFAPNLRTALGELECSEKKRYAQEEKIRQLEKEKKDAELLAFRIAEDNRKLMHRLEVYREAKRA